jgi:cytochrome c oxidase subunit IV
MQTTKQPAGIRTCTWVWLIMLALTLLTYLAGQAGLEGMGVSMTVLVFALVKGQLVGDYFMGLRGVRGFWRWPVSLWLFIPGALIGAAFALAA